MHINLFGPESVSKQDLQKKNLIMPELYKSDLSRESLYSFVLGSFMMPKSIFHKIAIFTLKTIQNILKFCRFYYEYWFLSQINMHIYRDGFEWTWNKSRSIFNWKNPQNYTGCLWNWTILGNLKWSVTVEVFDFFFTRLFLGSTGKSFTESQRGRAGRDLEKSPSPATCSDARPSIPRPCLTGVYLTCS